MNFYLNISPFSCKFGKYDSTLEFVRLDQIQISTNINSICYAHNDTQTPYGIGISWTSSSQRIYLYTYGSVLGHRL